MKILRALLKLAYERVSARRCGASLAPALYWIGPPDLRAELVELYMQRGHVRCDRWRGHHGDHRMSLTEVSPHRVSTHEISWPR